MAQSRMRILLAGLAALPTQTVPDGELLRRFAATRDEAAFEALVWRHGPLVKAVCRQVLGPRADADDAFQATFLVLARKANALRNERALAGWLYRIAGRVARKLLARTRKQPQAADLSAIAAAPVSPADAGLQRILDDEIGRLPEKYRLPVQLCYVAGQTTADAARLLGWPKGTLLTRLAWARRQLQERLLARGIAPGLGAIGTAAAVTLEPTLVRGAVQAAAAYAAGTTALLSTTALTLSEGVVHAMWLTKLKIGLGTLLVVGALGVGTVATVGGQVPGTGASKPVARKSPTPATAIPVPDVAPPKFDDVTLAPPALPDSVQQEIKHLRDENRLLVEELRMLRRPLARAELAPPAMSPLPAPMAAVNLPATTPLAIPNVIAPPELPAKPKLLYTATRPSGLYHRSVAGHTLQLKFEDTHLTITNAVQTTEGVQTVTIEADYSYTTDGIIFGYITGIDAPEEASQIHNYAEMPFSFRFRANEGSVTVKDVKVGHAPDQVPPMLIVEGRYTDKVQPAKPVRQRVAPPSSGVPSRAPQGSRVPSADPLVVPVPFGPPPSADEGPAVIPPRTAPANPLPRTKPPEDAEPVLFDSGEPVQARYILRRKFDAETKTYRSYYEPYTGPVFGGGGDPFLRPDGSHMLLSPGRLTPPTGEPRSDLPMTQRGPS